MVGRDGPPHIILFVKFFGGVVLQKFLFVREVVIVLGLDAADWFVRTRWAHNVAYLFAAVAFYGVVGLAGTLERMPL